MTTEAFENGLRVRKEVLGAEYVEAALANADELTRPFQQLLTEFCWGSVWTREGLPRRTRSLLNIVMMVVMNRPHELGLHIRGAVRNGCTQEEIVEALLQTAAYAGMPAALDGFRVATKVLAELAAEDGADGEPTAPLEER